MVKNVAFFQENLNDVVVSVNGTEYGVSAQVLGSTDSSGFFLQPDEDEVIDLCTKIDEETPYIMATFQREDASTYDLNSVDFIGSRPPRRPH